MCQYKLEKNSVKQNKWLKMKINTLLNMTFSIQFYSSIQLTTL